MRLLDRRSPKYKKPSLKSSLKNNDSSLGGKKLSTISAAKKLESAATFAYELSRDTQLP